MLATSPQIRDTRYYHAFGSSTIGRSVASQEVSFAQVGAAPPLSHSSPPLLSLQPIHRLTVVITHAPAPVLVSLCEQLRERGLPCEPSHYSDPNRLVQLIGPPTTVTYSRLTLAPSLQNVH